MDFNDRGGERGKRGEKRDSRLGQSQPHMAQHATHKCQTATKKKKDMLERECPPPKKRARLTQKNTELIDFH